MSPFCETLRIYSLKIKKKNCIRKMWIIRIFINLFYLLLKAVLSQETWKSHRVMWSVICPIQERVSNSSGSKWLTFIIWIFFIGIFHQNHMKTTSSDIRWYRGVLYPASLLSWLNKYVIFFDSSRLSHGTCAELISPILQCQAVSVIISCFQENFKLEQQNRKSWT